MSENSKQRAKRLKRERLAKEEEDKIEAKNKKERMVILERQQTKLFNEVCSDENIEFVTKLQNKDKEYIDELTTMMDSYTDLLAYEFGMGDICSFDQRSQSKKINSFPQDRSYLKSKHCFNQRKKDPENVTKLIPKYPCPNLPGYVFIDNVKTFIPQLYHILADFNFFYIYLDFPYMVDDSSVVYNGEEGGRYHFLSGMWAINLNDKVNEKSTLQEKKEHVEMLKCRIRRVQFLRAFDTNVCNHEYDAGTYKRESYNKLNDFYNGVYAILDHKLKSLDS